MNKKDEIKKSDAREPWEQSIYEPENDARHSRVEKRQSKKGNTFFLTILVFLLVMIIALPTGTYFWITRDKSSNSKNTNTTPSSSQVESVAKSSAESSAESQASTTEDSLSNEESADEGTPTSSDNLQQDNGQAVYDTVQSGEGFQQVAERNGITIADLERLNGMSRSTIIQPGDQLRVK